MLLHVEDARPRRVHRDAVNAVPDFGVGVGKVLGVKAPGDRPPRRAAVVGPEGARRRDRREHAVGTARIDQDRVEAHPAGARLPLRARPVAAQPGQLPPALAAVGRAEQGGVLDAGIHRVGIVERGLEVPDALEDPGLLGAVVELVSRERFAGLRRVVVDELVAFSGRHAARRDRGSAARRLPRLPSVVGALDHLSEPAARLRGVNPVGVGGRSLDVVDLPTGEVRTGDLPLPPLPIRRQDKRALARAHQDPDSAHRFSLLAPRAGSLTHRPPRGSAKAAKR